MSGRGESAVAVGAGSRFSVCVTENGSVYSWGSGSGGCLGIEGNISYWAPERVAAMEWRGAAKSVSCGWQHVLLQGEVAVQ